MSKDKYPCIFSRQMATIVYILFFPRSGFGEQGWRSGESAHLLPMCPGFDSQTRRHIEFVGSLPCFDRFFSGCSGFPLSSETNISKF